MSPPDDRTVGKSILRKSKFPAPRSTILLAPAQPPRFPLSLPFIHRNLTELGGLSRPQQQKPLSNKPIGNRLLRPQFHSPHTPSAFTAFSTDHSSSPDDIPTFAHQSLAVLFSRVTKQVIGSCSQFSPSRQRKFSPHKTTHLPGQCGQSSNISNTMKEKDHSFSASPQTAIEIAKLRPLFMQLATIEANQRAIIQGQAMLMMMFSEGQISEQKWLDKLGAIVAREAPRCAQDSAKSLAEIAAILDTTQGPQKN